MFDLRYHVASLTAVFLALVIGILVGVGLADHGLVDQAKKSLLEQRVAQLRTQLDQASQLSALSDREQKAAQLYAKETYPVLVHNRLRGKRVAVVFVGSVDGGVRSAVSQALTDAGAEQVRMRALKVPIDASTVDARLASQTNGKNYLGKAKLENLGKALGQELINGGDTPLWDTLTDTLVEEQFGPGKEPVDGVVVARTVPPQRAGTGKFLLGFYKGMSSSGLPAVGVETTDAAHSAVPVFRRGGLSSVDDIDTPGGRLGVVLLLAGSPPGQYGLKQSATQSFPPFPITARTGG